MHLVVQLSLEIDWKKHGDEIIVDIEKALNAVEGIDQVLAFDVTPRRMQYIKRRAKPVFMRRRDVVVFECSICGHVEEWSVEAAPLAVKCPNCWRNNDKTVGTYIAKPAILRR